MKATGIVRRIDDLGRVVIPKEIRRTLRIREGDPLEIFTDREGEIILKKYSPIGELGTFAKEYADSLGQVLGLPVCICDRDTVIAAAGGAKKEYQGKAISPGLERLIENRENQQVEAGHKKIPTMRFLMETQRPGAGIGSRDRESLCSGQWRIRLGRSGSLQRI